MPITMTKNRSQNVQALYKHTAVTICHVKDHDSLFKITDMDSNETKFNFKITKLKFTN